MSHCFELVQWTLSPAEGLWALSPWILVSLPNSWCETCVSTNPNLMFLWVCVSGRKWVEYVGVMKRWAALDVAHAISGLAIVSIAGSLARGWRQEIVETEPSLHPVPNAQVYYCTKLVISVCHVVAASRRPHTALRTLQTVPASRSSILTRSGGGAARMCPSSSISFVRYALVISTVVRVLVAEVVWGNNNLKNGAFISVVEIRWWLYLLKFPRITNSEFNFDVSLCPSHVVAALWAVFHEGHLIWKRPNALILGHLNLLESLKTMPDLSQATNFGLSVLQCFFAVCSVDSRVALSSIGIASALSGVL